VLAAEDRNFFRHSGIDPVGILRATWNDVRNRGQLQGGSTITQQYVKNAYLSVGRERTVTRKLREAVLAIKVERKLDKREILERYLNTIYFGRGAYGVEAASRAYFGKDVADVGLREAAYLAGLIRAPQYADALRDPQNATSRRHLVLQAMRRAGFITQDDQAEVEGVALTSYVINQKKDEPRVVGESSGTHYFVEYVRQQLVRQYGDVAVNTGGLRVKTTLDLRAQKLAFDAVYGFLEPGEPAGALVAIDDDGRIKAMVGGENWDVSKVNLAVGREGGGTGRHAGSTFKPFLLAAAIRDGFTAESAFSAPAKVVLPKANDGKDWTVENYEKEDYGDVNLIEATRDSINTVYAQAVVALGAGKVKTMAEDLGVRSPMRAVNALVLGTADVSPLDMASAFSTFADRGEHVSPRSILEVRTADGRTLQKATPAVRKRVLTTKQADTVNFALRQVVEHGTGIGASIGRPGVLIGKTGTTDDYGDAWMVGGTSRLTTAVWMGYPEARTHTMENVRGRKVNGGSLPAVIFKRFMEPATKGLVLAQYPDVSSFPGKALKGELLSFGTSTTEGTGDSTPRRTTTTTSAGDEPVTPSTRTPYSYPNRTYPTNDPDETRPPRRTTTTKKGNKNNNN
jgi:penicillin-binding protein 1A